MFIRLYDGAPSRRFTPTYAGLVRGNALGFGRGVTCTDAIWELTSGYIISRAVPCGEKASSLEPG